MCAGKFVKQDNIESAIGDVLPPGCSSFETQVALGTESGAIYVMTNFEVLYNVT